MRRRTAKTGNPRGHNQRSTRARAEHSQIQRTNDGGGYAQRIRLATQIGSGLAGVLYVLDEPSIGLHQRDNARLLGTLRRLRDLGNSVIVVEHDEETIRAADHIVDLGPGAGPRGGEIVAQGQLEDILEAKNSLTADYLSGRLRIPVPKHRTEPRLPKNGEGWL